MGAHRARAAGHNITIRIAAGNASRFRKGRKRYRVAGVREADQARLVSGRSAVMDGHRFVNPVSPEDAQEAIETLARPLKTLMENFDAGQLETNNRAVTMAALESALNGYKIAYSSLRGARNI